MSASTRLPLAQARLALLPYMIDADRPLICLDTETTGLGTAAGTLPFLVGIGRWDGETFRTRQLFLPEQPDEPAFLAALAAEIPPDAWLVTYNGRSFDWPLLVARYRLQRQAAPVHAGHLDLLPLARQLRRHRLPDARLASVERGIVGVVRHGDLPGALIPERYFQYLRTGRSSVLREVADHNRQDVLSLARLLVELASSLSLPTSWMSAHPGDVGALGRAYARRRRYDEALGCYETALVAAAEPRWSGRADHVLGERLIADRARVLARVGRREEAATSWLEIAETGGRLAAVAWLQVAKYREHRAGDLRGALQAAERAGTIAGQARRMGWPLPLIERDLVRRNGRLRRRLVLADRGGRPVVRHVAARAEISAPSAVRAAWSLPRLIVEAP
ncbi:MAG: ribonuclease H-like domain-containing protein [Chloroflexi bacterium]|nr:ribonuclease H-like domain-containing protein [Chloroflexota bacterium]